MGRFASAPGRLLIPVLLFVVILSMMYTHPSIPFANDGHCDPWYIFGMFYTFPSALHWWPGAYQISRLTEILPGYVFTRMFPGITADYALFLFNFTIAIVVFYGAARRLLTTQVAVLSSLFLALSPLMLGSYSSTLDAPAVTWDIVNLYFVAASMTCADPRRRYALIFASGIALALALDAYVAIGIFGVGNYVVYSAYVLVDGSRETRKRVYVILVSLLFAVGAALATFLLLGLVVVGFHGTFDEAFNQFDLFLRIIFDFHKSGSGGAVYWQSNWYAVGGVSGMLCLTAVASIVNLVYLCTGRVVQDAVIRNKLLAISAGALFIEIALLVANSLGFVLLQYDFYYVFFAPYLALLIFSPLVLCSAVPNRVLAVFAVLLYVGGLVANSFNYAQLPILYGGAGAQSLASSIIAVVVVALFAAAVLQRRVIALAVVVILGSSAIVTLRPINIGIVVWPEHHSDDQFAVGSYTRARQGLSYLHSLRLEAPPTVFWIDPNPSFGTELVAYPRSYLQCNFWSFPSHPADAAPLTAGDEVVVVASPDHLEQRATAALVGLNVRNRRLSQYQIDFGGVQYEILVLRITGPVKSAGGSAHGSLAAPPLSRDQACSGQLSETTPSVGSYD